MVVADAGRRLFSVCTLWGSGRGVAGGIQFQPWDSLHLAVRESHTRRAPVHEEP